MNGFFITLKLQITQKVFIQKEDEKKLAENNILQMLSNKDDEW